MDILITNAVVYTLTLLIYLCVVKKINHGVMLLGLYAFAAWSSVGFYSHDLFELSMHDSTMTWEPFVYLYIVLMIFFIPVLRFRTEKIESISIDSNSKFLYLSYFIIFISIICSVSYFPHMLKGMSGNISENRDMIMGGDVKIEFNFFVSLCNRICIALRDVAVLLFFYALAYHRKNKILLLLLAFSAFAPPLIVSFAWSARTIIVFLTLSFGACYLLFYKILSKKIRWTINTLFGVVLGLLGVVFLTISLSRFGDSDQFGLDFFMWKYAGESFVNFNGIMYDKIDTYLNGLNSFPFFRRLLGLEYWTSIDEFRQIAAGTIDIPSWIFYLFVGSFYMDFGPEATVVIAIVTCFIMGRYLKNGSEMPFHRLILFILIFNIYTEGIFYFSLYDESGNIKIILHILLFLFFRFDSKQLILKPN